MFTLFSSLYLIPVSRSSHTNMFILCLIRNYENCGSRVSVCGNVHFQIQSATPLPMSLRGKYQIELVCLFARVLILNNENHFH